RCPDTPLRFCPPPPPRLRAKYLARLSIGSAARRPQLVVTATFGQPSANFKPAVLLSLHCADCRPGKRCTTRAAGRQAPGHGRCVPSTRLPGPASRKEGRPQRESLRATFRTGSRRYVYRTAIVGGRSGKWVSLRRRGTQTV